MCSMPPTISFPRTHLLCKRTALPSDLYPPSFTDTATQAGVNVPRAVEFFDGCIGGDHLNGGGEWPSPIAMAMASKISMWLT